MKEYLIAGVTENGSNFSSHYDYLLRTLDQKDIKLTCLDIDLNSWPKFIRERGSSHISLFIRPEYITEYYELLKKTHIGFDTRIGFWVFYSKEFDIFSFNVNYSLPAIPYYFAPDSNSEELLIHFQPVYNLHIKIIKTELRLNEYIKDSFENIVNIELLQKQKLEIEALNDELNNLNRIDTLTKLYNRKALFEYLEKEKKRSERNLWRLKFPDRRKNGDTVIGSEPSGSLEDHIGIFSLLLLDIDFFKKVNDERGGHLIGDNVLRGFAEILMNEQIFRKEDFSARYGGEEFIVVLPNTNERDAQIPAARIQNILKETEFYDGDGNPFFITVSIGISNSVQGDESVEQVIARADEALYYAKEHGRNRIIIHSDIEEMDNKND